MAIDGVKIIDSDDGYDIYTAVVERYKNGENTEQIIDAMLAYEKEFCTDDFYREIYWTALAYSLWKIGHLPNKVKNRALEIIQKGANDFWLEIDSNGIEKRQKVLDKLAVQLQKDNPKPLKIPKGKPKRLPHFKVGDVLAVHFENEYGIIFVSVVDESPRKIEYHIACTRLIQKQKPTIKDFLSSQIACKKQNNKYALQTDCWFNHKELGSLLNSFEKIGEVQLEDYALYLFSPASDLEDIYKEIKRDQQSWQFELTNTCHLIKRYK